MNQVEWRGKAINRLELLRKRRWKFGWENLPFLLLYVYLGGWCLQTSGQPFKDAVDAFGGEAAVQEWRDRMEMLENGISRDQTKSVEVKAADKTTPVSTDQNSAFATLATAGIHRQHQLDKPTAPAGQKTPAKPLHETEEGPSLPNPYLPALVPLLLLLFTVCGHVLVRLGQVWSVRFQALIQYQRVSSVSSADSVLIHPSSFKGRSQIVELVEHSFFFFEKRKYLCTINDDDKVFFEKVKAPVHEKLGVYMQVGRMSEQDYTAKRQLYGLNEFDVPLTSFMTMYKEQLLAPLTVFQIFSISLWVLDEYWQYPLFTLCMILLFEGVTVLSRFKNLQTLRGMGNEKRDIFVFRYGQWEKTSTESLVPGDVMSLGGSDSKMVVPCDVLLLRGTAVVNEATLTGESVPQMKEMVAESQSEEELQMKGEHKVHLLFGGTTILQHSNPTIPTTADQKKDSIPPPPDQGVVVYALRTGFSASQGKLVRMIEFSSGQTKTSNRDAIGLAILLLFFALLSSGYVLMKGLAKNKQNKLTFDLLLRCVLIITSVIPAELPMQTSLAINSALLTLVRLQIFCTEPFRINLAGKINICLFDKTGTITTDQLTAVGLTLGNEKNVGMADGDDASTLVLAGCHSLVAIDGEIMGDPVEEAALKAIQFKFDPATKMSQPNEANTSKKMKVKILHRNHFASTLQRMSVLVEVTFTQQQKPLEGDGIYSLVKGSPERIATLLTTKPTWYDATYQQLAKKGMRVLALAYKKVSTTGKNISKQSREWAETDLIFAGFASFQCLVRKDSETVLSDLKNSSHFVTMITGDALLTALHVAKQVKICTRPTLLLNVEKETEKLVWESYESNEFHSAFQCRQIKKLAQHYDLAITGKMLQQASSLSSESDKSAIWDQLEWIRVFARMTPELKETVLSSLKRNGHHTLMCGDGANDVGALKQADVGVALLSGFGSLNADKNEAIASHTNNKKHMITKKTYTVAELRKMHLSVLKKKTKDTFQTKEEYVQAILKSYEKTGSTNKLVEATKQKKKGLSKEEQKELLAKKQADIEADVAARTARGESFARIKALAAFAKREAAEAKEKAQQNKKNGGFAGGALNHASMEKYLADFDDGEALPMVKLGDASIASPFTSRAPSIQATVDIIRQGRCALVTSMQMYQILAINCLISSYSLSVLYLDRVKYGNAQMIALGMISTVASVTLSRASPLPNLSSVRPLTTIFHPALFVSLLGQFGLHLACMIHATSLAKLYTTPETDAQALLHHQKTTSSASGIQEFTPNIMSTVTFLVNAVQTVSVCAVNYKGRPFMKGMADNPGLLYSLGASLIGVFLASTEAMPLFNKLVQIVPMPDLKFARVLLSVLVFDVVGAFVWDQLCLLMFAPHIFWACVAATTRSDLRKFVKMAVISLIVITILSNIDYDEIEKQQQLLQNQKVESISS